MKFIITEEQSEKFNQKVKSMVNKYGFEETLRLFENNSDIIKRAYQDNPESFLYQYNNLSPIEKDNEIYYLDKDRLPLFTYDPNEKNWYVYINYHKIWNFFTEVIGLNYNQIQSIIKKWLSQTYNLTGLTPHLNKWYVPIKLEENYNIK